MGLLAYLIVRNSKHEKMVGVYCPQCENRVPPVVYYRESAEQGSIPGRVVYTCPRCGKKIYCDRYAEPALLSPEHAYELCSKGFGKESISAIHGALWAVSIMLALMIFTEIALKGVSAAAVIMCIAELALIAAHWLAVDRLHAYLARKYALELLEQSMRRLADEDYRSTAIKFCGADNNCFLYAKQEETIADPGADMCKSSDNRG